MEFGFRAGDRRPRRPCPGPDRRFTPPQGKRTSIQRSIETADFQPLKVPAPAQPGPSMASRRRPRRSSGRPRRGASRSSARRWSGGSSRRRSAASSPLRAPASTAVSAPSRSSGPTAPPSCRHHPQARSSCPMAHSCRQCRCPRCRWACIRTARHRLCSGRGRGSALGGSRDLGNRCSPKRRERGPCRLRSRGISSSCARSRPARALRFGSTLAVHSAHA